jgi:hypothetical protein
MNSRSRQQIHHKQERSPNRPFPFNPGTKLSAILHRFRQNPAQTKEKTAGDASGATSPKSCAHYENRDAYCSFVSPLAACKRSREDEACACQSPKWSLPTCLFPTRRPSLVLSDRWTPRLLQLHMKTYTITTFDHWSATSEVATDWWSVLFHKSTSCNRMYQPTDAPFSSTAHR